LKDIKAVQRTRQGRFPSDRICFAQIPSAASNDAIVMRQYAEGQISLQMLCRCLERNNYLDRVTESQALNELKIIGWI
jgi:hypothetical protein